MNFLCLVCWKVKEEEEEIKTIQTGFSPWHVLDKPELAKETDAFKRYLGIDIFVVGFVKFSDITNKASLHDL